MAEQAVAEASTKGSKKMVLILGGVVVLLLVVLGAGAAWYFLAGGSESPAEEQAAVVKKPEAIYVQLRTLGGKPSFIANFYDQGRRQRFMQVFAVARTREESSAEALKKHMPLVVYALTTLFSNQSFTDMQTAEGKERLRLEATAKVQEILQKETGKPGIDEVFFTNFVMQ